MQFPSKSELQYTEFTLSSFSCHWLYFRFVDRDPIHFTTTIYNDLPLCFIHLSSLTHKERALEMPSCWCLFHTMQTLSSSVTEYVPRNLCLSIPQPQSYQGFWKMLKCTAYIGKNGLFLVGGKGKSGLSLCKIHWQSSTLSLGYFQGHLVPPQLSRRNWKPVGEEK